MYIMNLYLKKLYIFFSKEASQCVEQSFDKRVRIIIKSCMLIKDKTFTLYEKNSLLIQKTVQV